jgi:hypothetical protein
MAGAYLANMPRTTRPTAQKDGGPGTLDRRSAGGYAGTEGGGTGSARANKREPGRI